MAGSNIFFRVIGIRLRFFLIGQSVFTAVGKKREQLCHIEIIFHIAGIGVVGGAGFIEKSVEGLGAAQRGDEAGTAFVKGFFVVRSNFQLVFFGELAAEFSAQRGIGRAEEQIIRHGQVVA